MKILRPYGLGLLLLGPVLVAVAGCTSRPAVADPPPPPPPPTAPAPAHYQGPLRASMSYPGLGIELRPPTVLAPLISWQQAYRGACSNGEAFCQPGLSPTIVLADATLTNSSVRVSTPVYAITSTDVPCYPKGPGPVPNSPNLCVVVSLVDANTGTVAYAASGTTP